MTRHYVTQINIDDVDGTITSGGATTLDGLTDVTLTSPATGATLVYNGTLWVDGQLDLADADAKTGILPVANGGTGVATFTDAGVLIGNVAGAVAVTTAGTAGQVLTSNGAGVDPTFQASGAVTTGLDGLTDVTLTSPATGSVLVKTATDWVDGQLDLADADARTGILPVANGGSGVATLTNHGVVIGQAAGAFAATSAGTAGQVLTSNGAAADPTFQAGGSGSVSDVAYPTGWDGDTTTAPSRNAVFDAIVAEATVARNLIESGSF